jgi:hypothetical protein
VTEGQPKYLARYEFEHPFVSENEAWSRARPSNPWTRQMSPNLRHDEAHSEVRRPIFLQ